MLVLACASRTNYGCKYLTLHTGKSKMGVVAKEKAIVAKREEGYLYRLFRRHSAFPAGIRRGDLMLWYHIARTLTFRITSSNIVICCDGVLYNDHGPTLHTSIEGSVS